MLISYVQAEFSRRKKANPRYSLRAFARSLRIDHSTLAKLLKRSRKTTASQALKIVQALDMDPAMKSTLLLSVIEGKAPLPADELRFVDADPDAEGMGYWEFYAVLSLLELPGAKHSVKWLAKRLNSTESRVAACVRGLEKRGYLRPDGKRWSVTSVILTNPPRPKGPAIRQAQYEYIMKGSEALDHPIDTRDISGSTVAIAMGKIPEAWRRIGEFRRSLSDYLADGPKDGVYRLNIQLFRLDRGDA